MPVFDRYQNTAFDKVTNNMGQPAVWHKEGGDVQADVLYKDPNKSYKIGPVTYSPETYSIEYKKGTAFDTLVAVSRSSDVIQEITVDGKVFGVSQGSAEWDGKTYKVNLELKTED